MRCAARGFSASAASSCALGDPAPEEREVLVLRYAEDLSREEIARLCDLEIATVKSRLFTGLKKLCERVAALDSRASAGQ